MQNRGDADVGAEMLGIGCDRQHGLGRGFEQQVVDDRLVLVGDIGDRSRQCEHDVKVADGQQLRLTLGEPCLGGSALALGAVPVAAAIVDDDHVGALVVLAARHMAAEHRRAAVLDRTHDLHLAEAHMAGIGFAPRRPVVAEDIRDLQRWTGHGAVFTALAVGLPAQRAIAQRFCGVLGMFSSLEVKVLYPT